VIVAHFEFPKCVENSRCVEKEKMGEGWMLGKKDHLEVTGIVFIELNLRSIGFLDRVMSRIGVDGCRCTLRA